MSQPSPSSPRITLVVAAGRNGVIGRDNAMPWRMPSSLKRFRALTMGRPMVMGRKTFESIGKALDGRDTIVVTRNKDFAAPGIIVAASLDEALAQARACAAARGADEIAIVGGGEIYRAAAALADRIYLDLVDAAPEGDATFDLPDPAHWREVERGPMPRHARDEHAAEIVVLDRIRA